MGVPTSRFMLLHRMILLPPLMLLTLTCLYTSSTLSPFNTTRHVSFSQEVQCFSCESSSFPSRSFLSLVNFPAASSYIRDVVLRQNVLQLEDSHGETTDPVTLRDADEVESVGLEGMENVPDEVDPHLVTTRRVKEDVGRLAEDEQTSGFPQHEFDNQPLQQGRVEEANASPSLEKHTENSEVGDSVAGENAAPAEEKVDNSTSSDDELDSSVPTDNTDADSSVVEGEDVDRSVQIVEFSTEKKENFEGGEKEHVPDSVGEDKNVDRSVQVVEVSAELKENSEGGRKEDVGGSISEDENADSSIQVVEVSTETKENYDGGGKADWGRSVPEDKNADTSIQVLEVATEVNENSSGRKEDVVSSVPEDQNADRTSIQVVDVPAETNENSEGGKVDVVSSIPEDQNADPFIKVVETKEDFEGGGKDDLQVENRHLTSDDHSSPDEHTHAPIEANVNVTEEVLEPTAEQISSPPVKEYVMKFGHENMTEEHRIAGIAVQQLMDSITKSGLPTEDGNSLPDADVDVNLLLRGGSPQGVPLPEGRSCHGQHVFVYNLPSKFNADLVGQCDTLLEWFDFCDYFMNEGMGTNVPTDELNDRGEKVLVPDGSWFLTHQYALELIFHARLKHYPCLTTDVNQADLFFVPYYAGLDVIRWHFQPNVSNDRRDELTFELMGWLESQETWSRNDGIDHVFVLGKIGWDFRRAENSGDWGSKLLRLPTMWAPTKVLIERDPWHDNDVGVPHPTFFHPKDDGEVRTWLDHVERSERRYLVSFAGMPRPNMLGNVRGHLIQQCMGHPDDCFLLRCVETLCLRPDSTMNLFLHSHFCMQPPGDSPTRRSVFDSLVGGCIPVLFDPYTAYYQYPWHLPQNASSYSVFIPSHDVMAGESDVVEILKSISPEERTAMRTRIIREIIPGLLYSQPGTKHSDFRDAFDISIEALLHRVATLKAAKQQPI